jgi:hypothetical protein
MSNQQQTDRQSLKDTLLERIEQEHLCPRSTIFFRSKECLIWFWWILSVMVGALAVAVLQYILIYRSYALFEVTHDNFWIYLLEVVPYVWIVVFSVMIFIAVYNLRHTRRGYRYSLKFIIGSSLILSLVGGSLLYYFGLGQVIDNQFGRYASLYASQNRLEHEFWQKPLEGRMLGKQVNVTLEPGRIIVFADVEGARWVTDVQEISVADRELLAIMEQVRLLGMVKSAENKLFKACWVLPWVLPAEASMGGIKETKKEFYKRLQQEQDWFEMNTGPTVYIESSDQLMLIEDELVTNKFNAECADMARKKGWLPSSRIE